MIFKFAITGKETDVVDFEKKLIDIFIRFLGNSTIAHEIHFCVHEAILNIVQHTYKWDLKLGMVIKVRITYQHSEEIQIEIIIRDYGPPIQQKITPPKSVETFQLRKRGLYMIQKIMDDFSIRPKEKNGNMTYLKKTVKMISDGSSN